MFLHLKVIYAVRSIHPKQPRGLPIDADKARSRATEIDQSSFLYSVSRWMAQTCHSNMEISGGNIIRLTVLPAAELISESISLERVPCNS
jgi:hypothetical protein